MFLLMNNSHVYIYIHVQQEILEMKNTIRSENIGALLYV